MSCCAHELIEAASRLRDAVAGLKFRSPVANVYNPLDYAWAAHKIYLRKFGDVPKRVVFLGMNPGPFGMMQTGVPFGDVDAVRDWMHIEAKIHRPDSEHPKRPVLGFDCPRSEISGKRLWGLFAARFGAAEKFFADYFVANYCPLAFLDKGGRNLTPDKLRLADASSLFRACDQHLRRAVEILRPGWLIGVGDFAERRAREVIADTTVKVGRILHPSPASPAANRDWAGQATKQLRALGIW